MLIPDFYTVLAYKYESTKIYAKIELNAAHDIFKGHFPHNPVTPGVCMLQVFKELCETALQNTLFISECKNVKFTALINPFHNPLLDISLDLIELDPKRYKLSGTALFLETTALKVNAILTIKE